MYLTAIAGRSSYPGSYAGVDYGRLRLPPHTKICLLLQQPIANHGLALFCNRCIFGLFLVVSGTSPVVDVDVWPNLQQVLFGAASGGLRDGGVTHG